MFSSIQRTSAKQIDLDISPYYADYMNLTVDNLIYEPTSDQTPNSSSNTTVTYSKTYNASTGILTITASYQRWSSTSSINKCIVYIAKGINQLN